MIARSVIASLGLVGSVSAGACVIAAPSADGPPRQCNGKPCAEHGHCERKTDACRCDSGYVGNPYAAYGCQPVRPSGDCSTTCGLNARCDGEGGGCVCVDGFVAVCGVADCLAEAALCDGVSDCANADDERAEVCFETVVMEWSVGDDCEDGVSTQWRLWATERDWVWPGPEQTFHTPALHERGVESVECVQGETVCLGASAGELDWGVGLSGVLSCDDCCEPCRPERIEYGGLGCQ